MNATKTWVKWDEQASIHRSDFHDQTLSNLDYTSLELELETNAIIA